MTEDSGMSHDLAPVRVLTGGSQFRGSRIKDASVGFRDLWRCVQWSEVMNIYCLHMVYNGKCYNA